MEFRPDPDTQRQVIADLQRYFREELDQDIGDLKAELLSQFIYAHIGPVIYRKAILDAQSHLQDKLLDMEVILQLQPPGTRSQR